MTQWKKRSKIRQPPARKVRSWTRQEFIGRLAQKRRGGARFREALKGPRTYKSKAITPAGNVRAVLKFNRRFFKRPKKTKGYAKWKHEQNQKRMAEWRAKHPKPFGVEDLLDPFVEAGRDLPMLDDVLKDHGIDLSYFETERGGGSPIGRDIKSGINNIITSLQKNKSLFEGLERFNNTQSNIGRWDVSITGFGMGLVRRASRNRPPR